MTEKKLCERCGHPEHNKVCTRPINGEGPANPPNCAEPCGCEETAEYKPLFIVRQQDFMESFKLFPKRDNVLYERHTNAFDQSQEYVEWMLKRWNGPFYIFDHETDWAVVPDPALNLYIHARVKCYREAKDEYDELTARLKPVMDQHRTQLEPALQAYQTRHNGEKWADEDGLAYFVPKSVKVEDVVQYDSEQINKAMATLKEGIDKALERDPEKEDWVRDDKELINSLIYHMGEAMTALEHSRTITTEKKEVGGYVTVKAHSRPKVDTQKDSDR